MHINNVCIAQLVPRCVLFFLFWCYRFLNFTHVEMRAIGLLWLLSALSLLAYSLSLSLSPDLPIFRSFSHPRRRNPLLFYTARPVFVSFCLPLCFSLPLSLCLFMAYYMRFRAFHLCTPIVRTG